jgi:hypothetical protein
MSNPLDNTMTVSELIETLKDYDGKTPVVFGSDYGDIGRTLQLFGIQENSLEIEGEHKVVETGYSQTGFCLDESEDSDDYFDDEDECRFCGDDITECDCDGPEDVLVITLKR